MIDNCNHRPSWPGIAFLVIVMVFIFVPMRPAHAQYCDLDRNNPKLENAIIYLNAANYTCAELEVLRLFSSGAKLDSQTIGCAHLVLAWVHFLRAETQQAESEIDSAYEYLLDLSACEPAPTGDFKVLVDKRKPQQPEAAEKKVDRSAAEQAAQGHETPPKPEPKGDIDKADSLKEQADEAFSSGEYDKARGLYEKARDIYEELWKATNYNDTPTRGHYEEQIRHCEQRIEKTEDGKKIHQWVKIAKNSAEQGKYYVVLDYVERIRQVDSSHPAIGELMRHIPYYTRRH